MSIFTGRNSCAIPASTWYFLLLNFKVVPRLARKDAVWWHALLLVLTFVGVGLVTGITDTHYKGHRFFMYYAAEAFWAVSKTRCGCCWCSAFIPSSGMWRTISSTMPQQFSPGTAS